MPVDASDEKEAKGGLNPPKPPSGSTPEAEWSGHSNSSDSDLIDIQDVSESTVLLSSQEKGLSTGQAASKKTVRMEESSLRKLEEGKATSIRPSIATTNSKTSTAFSRSTKASTLSQTKSYYSATNPNKGGPAVIEVTSNPIAVGDAFPTGDIYEEKLVPLAVDVDTVPLGPYFRHIQDLSRQYPRLEHLADNMKISTVPTKGPALENEPKEVLERLERTHVMSLDFTDPSRPLQQEFTDCHTFAQYLEIVSNEATTIPIEVPEEPKARSRLFIVEDLSRTVIESLGSTFNIDPTFFRGHLDDHTWFNVRDNWVEFAQLPSQLDKRPYFNLRYMEPRFFESQEDVDRAKEECSNFNVLRRLDFEGQVKCGIGAWWHSSPNQVGLLRRKISFWNGEINGGWVGILLVDPPCTSGVPLWKGYGRLDEPTSFKSGNSLSKPEILPTKSLFENLVSTFSNLSTSDVSQISEYGSDYLTSKIYPFVFGEYLVMQQYTFTGLFQIEWELDSERTRKAEDISRALDSLHKWQRRIPFVLSWISDGIASLNSRYKFDANGKSTANIPSYAHSILRDYKYIHDHFLTLQIRIDKIMSMATAIIAIEESKKAMQESRSISRVTYLAFIFVPLSFVASFLSMNSDLALDPQVYWVFFVIAAPLAAVSVVVARYWGEISRFCAGGGRFEKLKEKEN
ncbi:hypothetical protein BJ508DRAFT_242872 [Ascobolus immersus RN42]|uniref:Cora-domain-containing protein n=1 Tax=Ascobolus immersus RN42 TaxID=1160509 RepID=A0A3N4HVW5_ASCIM|nr:hypothetical protein BJ508DRAFT_242872 [Ascobolus immersus RN42]